MATAATYFPYSELNNGKPSTLNEFRRELGAYARSRILHLCSALNAMLRSEDDDFINQKAHDGLVRAFFEPQVAEHLLRKDGDVRFVFYRQQILFVAKTAVLICPEEGLVPGQAEFRRLGKIFLMAGDHLPTLQAKPEPLDDKFVFFASHFVPVQEASGFHRFDHKIARSYKMLMECAPKIRNGAGPHLDLADIFEETTKLPLLTFLSLLFGSLARFNKFDPQAFVKDPRSYGLNKTWFATTKIPTESIDRFLALVSTTPAEFRSAYEKANQGPSDFTPFRDRPLFRDGDYLFLIDFAFLAEKFETGPFWIIHNSLPDKPSKDGLHAFWGRVFEKYGCDVLNATADQGRNVVYESPNFTDMGKGQVCDAIVVCGSSAAFIELKGSTFSSRAKYGGDYLQLKVELDRKLVEDGDGSPKAVLQLKRAIELTCGKDRSEPINDVDLSRVRYVYPVIVTRDDIGSTLGVNAFLQIRFDAVAQRKQMKKIVTPMFCMNAEDLERLTAYFHDTLFTDLLEAHYRASREHGEYLVNPYFSAGNNAILKEKGIRRPEVHVHSWHELADSAAEHLGLQPEGDIGTAI